MTKKATNKQLNQEVEKLRHKMADIILDRRKTGALTEVVQHFIVRAGGSEAFANLLYAEMQEAKPGGLIRARLLDLIVSILKFTQSKEPPKEDVALISNEDLEREFAEGLGQFAVVARREAELTQEETAQEAAQIEAKEDSHEAAQEEIQSGGGQADRPDGEHQAADPGGGGAGREVRSQGPQPLGLGPQGAAGRGDLPAPAQHAPDQHSAGGQGQGHPAGS